LHLIANEPGTYDGISANYSGAGFAGMKFKAIATPTAADFDAWVAKAKQQATKTLDSATYQALAQKSENNPVEYFGSVSHGMFDQIVMQYMHMDSNEHMAGHEGMEHMSADHNMAGMHHDMAHMASDQKMADMEGSTHSDTSSTEHSSTHQVEAE
jgi:cytochrome o ubiquinol oxidase subunit 2